MRYFHRASIGLDDVLAEADSFFGSRLESSDAEARTRVFTGTIGRIELKVQAEGGHYTLITLTTDQVTESEADKLVKRFMGGVHRNQEPSHQLRGAY
jgi:hypothetical protein